MPLDELTEYLLHDRRHAKISPEMLEMMGKEAAHRLLNERVPLNTSIVKLAGQYPGINSDQVKRICEFANTATYLAQHDKNKTAGAQSSYPQFALADASQVLEELSEEGRPERASQVDASYGRAPKTKTAGARGDEILAEAFGVKEAEGRADLPFTKTAAVDEIVTTKQDLMALKEHIQSSAQVIENLQKQASADYYEAVKQHLLEGGSFAEVLAAANSVGAPTEKVAAVIKPVVVQLLKEKVARPERLANQAQDFTKLAHRVVNNEHPLVSLFGALYSFNDEVEKIATGLEDIDVELGKVNTFLKEQTRARSSR